jgi:hypothetical protein
MENIQHEFFIWEENNYIEQKKNDKNNNESVHYDTTTEIKNDLTQKDWKDITNPKERRKVYLKTYNKKYREANKDKIKVLDKSYRENNKDSVKNKQRMWREANKDKIKAWRETNKDKINLYNKKYGKEYYNKNKDKLNKNKKKLSDEEIKILKERRKIQKRAYAIANYYSNKEKKLSYQKNYNKLNNYKRKLWLESNKDSLKSKQKEYNKLNKDKKNSYVKNRKKTDIQYKLSCNLRCRLYKAIKNKQKVGSAIKDLGCSIEELKQHLESKFQPGMTWDNWTTDGWHIDHIKPLASFDLTDKQQLLEACHYTNLQPLWAIDNFIKNDKNQTFNK